MIFNYLQVLLLLMLETFLKIESEKCDVMATQFSFEDQHTIVDVSEKLLTGTWLSKECEIHSGPEYLLKSYSFNADGTYKLIQHRYWDESCSIPKLTIISTGSIRLKKDTFLNIYTFTGYSKSSNITIIPQDFKAVKELNKLVSVECPGLHHKPWKKYEKHIVFQNKRYLNPEHYSNYMYHDQYSKKLDTYQTCLTSLKLTFDELSLIKIQFRPIYKKSTHKNEINRMQLELFLGDVLQNSENYAFQTALIKYIKEERINVGKLKIILTNTCNICSSLYINGEIPPHLVTKPTLPPYIKGVWISRRCEISPMGLYLTRQFSFFSAHYFWMGQHIFYSDPFCTSVKFVIKTNGHYVLSGQNDAIKSATNIDFKIEKATLTIFNSKMVRELRKDGSCGNEIWEIGVPQELTLTYGCMQLGIVLPAVQYDIVKVEIDYDGNFLLYMGQADAQNGLRNIFNRPTSFQCPLIKCSDEENNENFKYYFSNSAKMNVYHFKLLVSTFIIYNFLNFYYKF